MFSKSCEYGIRAVLYLATKNEKERVGINEISDSLNAPRHFLAKILQQLTKNNLISSVKGPGGGFFMTQEDKSRDLLGIIKCIDGPDILDRCILGLPECSSIHPCTFHEKTVGYRKSMMQILENEPIALLAEKIVKDNLTI